MKRNETDEVYIERLVNDAAKKLPNATVQRLHRFPVTFYYKDGGHITIRMVLTAQKGKGKKFFSFSACSASGWGLVELHELANSADPYNEHYKTIRNKRKYIDEDTQINMLVLQLQEFVK